MNIKPTKKQIEDWELKAAQYADSQTGEYFYEYQLAKNEKFAELAAQWGAAQAQQTTEKGTACSTSNFRKKPVVIQAKQLTEETIREVYEWVHGPVTLKHRLAEDRWDDYCGIVKTDGMNIPTLEDGSDGRAKHVASIGDWIIRGIAGEFYPCKPDIFAATYEPVAQAQQPTVKEPELPEAAVNVSPYDPNHVYWNAGHSNDGVNSPLFTVTQMHDHFAATTAGPIQPHPEHADKPTQIGIAGTTTKYRQRSSSTTMIRSNTMTKDHAILTMVCVASIGFAVWQNSVFAGLFVFGLVSVYVFEKGWK